jgi:hypothetical protein
MLVFAKSFDVTESYAATDQFKKELIRRFIPNLVMHSGDETRTGLPVEPEPVEIMINHSNYHIFLTTILPEKWISNHGSGAPDLANHLDPRGKLYWRTILGKSWITSSFSCLYGPEPIYPSTCADSLLIFLNYIDDPNNCNNHPFCCKSCGLQGYPYYHGFDWPGNNPDGWKDAYDQHGPFYEPTVYTTFFEDDNYYIIQYYYFYPFNDFVNDHEGDWENINVYIKKDNLFKIHSIDYLFHHAYIHIENQSQHVDNMIDIVGSHPVLYIGGYGKFSPMEGNASHGIFPYPAKYDNVIFFLDENVDGLGKIIKWRDFKVKYMLDDNGSDWFYKPAHWGSLKDGDLGWVEELDCILGTCKDSIQWSPPTRIWSKRWKKKAQETEAEEYKHSLPERSNHVALNKLKAMQISITPILELLLLSPIPKLTEIGKDKVKFYFIGKPLPPDDNSGCTPKSDFVGRFNFNARLENITTDTTLSELVVEVAELRSLNTGKRENRLILPNESMGGIGATFPIPREDYYDDGVLERGKYVDVRFDVCLGSRDRFEFYVNLLGVID